ncbi:MAG TPA: hypothetical protein DCP51_05735 [Clostridiales bacterium]|nr:MAG: hypothetical protein A2Y40_00980 [Candidatus Margulisbacteria bacterium GWF2_35_9]HAN21161.1 hypothetical protein [Clostridiales bacterium]
MRINKFVLCLFFIIGITFIYGCENKPDVVISNISQEESFQFTETKINLSEDYFELLSNEEISTKGHIGIIDDLTTDISIVFMNKDKTKSLYVYSSPINYLDSNGKYSLIDTRIINVNNKMREQNYIYTISNSDIIPYYPKYVSNSQGILINGVYNYKICPIINDEIYSNYEEHSNFIDEDKNMIVYNNINNKYDLRLYPSNLGSNCEIIIDDASTNEFLFNLNLSDSSSIIEIQPGGYLTISKVEKDKKGNDVKNIKGVIQSPLLKSSSGNISYKNSIELKKINDSTYEIKFIIDKDIIDIGSVLFISFELRREKQPDNAIYSKKPNLKYAYLKNNSIVGISDDYGIGRVLIRYKFVKYYSLLADTIISASYTTYNISNNVDTSYKLVSVLEDWCSITGNWNNKYKTGDVTSVLKSQNQTLIFDITNEVKKWCEDKTGLAEHNGVMLRYVDENEGDYSIILSNDNTLFRVVTEVKLK